MKTQVTLRLVAALSVVFVCFSPRSVGSPPELKERMQSMYRSLADLLTDVCSDQRYSDPKNSSRIEQEITALSKFSHDLSKKESGSVTADPTFPIIGGFLAGETASALRAFREGHRDYARSVLRSVPGYCIECHSRNPIGADFQKLALEPSADLGILDRARFYAATRQFDRSIEAFQKVVRGETKGVTPYAAEDAVRSAMTIAVRFKRNPELATNILQSAEVNLELPKFLEDDIRNWRESIREWSKGPKPKAATEAGLYAEAQRLIAQARKKQTYPLDHSADVLYLRASSTLFDLLQLAPNGKYAAEALMLQGMCYEVLSPRHLESLHYLFYEACIKQAPHTEVARSCYHRYERSIFFGYSGSAGTELPQEIQDKLLELWSVASRIKEK